MRYSTPLISISLPTKRRYPSLNAAASVGGGVDPHRLDDGAGLESEDLVQTVANPTARGKNEVGPRVDVARDGSPRRQLFEQICIAAVHVDGERDLAAGSYCPGRGQTLRHDPVGEDQIDGRLPDLTAGRERLRQDVRRDLEARQPRGP
jgi:hypothetical protein